MAAGEMCLLLELVSQLVVVDGARGENAKIATFFLMYENFSFEKFLAFFGVLRSLAFSSPPLFLFLILGRVSFVLEN